MIRVLMILALVAVAAIEAAAPARTQSDLQKIVYLADHGPVRIDLHIRLDGKGFRVTHREFIDKLFNYLDQNGDGVLSKAEAAGAPPAAVLNSPTSIVTGQNSRLTLDTNGDDNVSREELARFYAASGLPAFQIGTGERQTGIIRLDALGGAGPVSAEAISARLFQMLDRDGDGKLSTEELKAVEGILGKLDRDEDELISAEELQGDTNRPVSDGADVFVRANRPELARNTSPMREIAATGKDPALAKALLQRYGGKDAKTLTAKQLGISDRLFAKLDSDANGKLDESELSCLAEVPGDIELQLQLGKRADKEPVLRVLRSRPGLKATLAEGGVTLELNNVAVELRGPGNDQGVFKIDINGQYSTQFQMADTDGNGYLDRTEAEKSGFFRNLFTVMDRDGDGMLYEKEMMAYVNQVGEFRDLASKSCLSLGMKDVGKGLFEMIDSDGNGKLSIRELRAMPALIARLDKDGDGKLARLEVPRRYRGTFEPGSSSTSDPNARVVVFAANGMPTRTSKPEQIKGPLWYRKMDRNRDGDISRNEWLGTPEEFARADTDGDGLISLAEAEAHDRKARLARGR